MAQHVHPAINGLEVILLGWLATPAVIGTYAFLLSLAAEANAASACLSLATTSSGRYR